MINCLFRRVSNIQILLNTASSIAMIVDSIVIGKFLGLEAIAAYGAVTPLLMIIMAMAQVLSTGGQIRCSAQLGKSKLSEANGIASLTVFIGLVFSLLALAVTVAFQGPICAILGVSESEELIRYTKEYMVGFIIGAPAFVGMLVLVPFVQLDGDKQCVLTAVTVMTVGDIIGDLLVVTVFNGGMFGIGLASSLSYYISLVILLFHFLGKKAILHLKFTKMRFPESGPIIAGGLPAAIQKVLRSLLSLTLNHVLMAIGGSTALGIFSVVNSIINLCNSCGQGMGAGTLLLAGIYSAEEDKQGLNDIVKAFLSQSVIYNAVVFVLVCIFASPLISLFTKSGEVDASLAAIALRLGATDFVFFSIANCFKNLYQGLRNQVLTYVLTVSEAFLFSALVAWPLGKLFGVNGVCMVYTFGDFMTILLLLILLAVKKRPFRFRLDNLILLPAGFGLPEEDVYKVSLSAPSDLEQVQKDVDYFLKNHGEVGDSSNIKGKLQSVLLQLAQNIFAYGFKEKKSHLDFSLLYKNEEYILRFRDDCPAFNPVEYHDKNPDPNGEHGLGKVFASGGRIQYLGTLGLNNLNLHFSGSQEDTL